MPQQSFGPLQSFVDDLSNPLATVRKALSRKKAAAPAKAVDTSYHDKAVEEANESFRKAAAKPAADPKLGGKKKTKTAAKKKAAVKKR